MKLPFKKEVEKKDFLKQKLPYRKSESGSSVSKVGKRPVQITGNESDACTGLGSTDPINSKQ